MKYTIFSILLNYFLSVLVDGIPCNWDMNVTQEQIASMDCGHRCESYWDHSNPHYCGFPHPCCCSAKCNREDARASSFVGVNWNDRYSKRPIPRTQQFQILKDSGFFHIKIFSPSGLHDIYRVYNETANVYVGIPNKQLPQLASSLDYARKLVREQLLPYQSIIKLVIVANEPLLCIKSKDWLINNECGIVNPPLYLLPSMKMMKKALEMEGLNIRVSTAFNGGILEMSQSPWTPCVADYREILKPILQPIWALLREMKSPVIVNLYSWFAAINHHISVRYGVGLPDGALRSDGKFKYYFNFDMQADMNTVAMCKNGISDLELWIGETGWPSSGHPKGTLNNSYWYNYNIIRRAYGLYLNDETKDTARLTGGETNCFNHFSSCLAGMPMSIFLFEAFDEMRKDEIERGNKFENTFGLFFENGIPKWRDINGMIKYDLTGKRVRVSEPPMPSEYISY